MNALANPPALQDANRRARDFQIQRDCLSVTRFVDLTVPVEAEVAPGELLLGTRGLRCGGGTREPFGAANNCLARPVNININIDLVQR